MKKILLICDRPNWAYDSIARSLKKYNTNSSIGLDIFYLKNNEAGLKDLAAQNIYDLYFFLGWQLLAKVSKGLLGRKYSYRYPFIEPDRVITGIHSHHAWDNKRTQPDSPVYPDGKLIKFLSRFRGVNAVSKRLNEIFRKSGLESCRYTPNGVDTGMFRPIKQLGKSGRLKVGYSGSIKHDWRKGITEYIEPACKKAGVDLMKAMPVDDSYVPLEEMPGFYNDISVYLCASSSEGFSLSVLEAAACGRPVISTRVGGSEDLITDGENGFLVSRDVDEIAEKLRIFREDRELLGRMGEKSRMMVLGKWSWKSCVNAWIDFITAGE